MPWLVVGGMVPLLDLADFLAHSSARDVHPREGVKRGGGVSNSAAIDCSAGNFRLVPAYKHKKSPSGKGRAFKKCLSVLLIQQAWSF